MKNIEPVIQGKDDHGTVIMNGLMFYPAERVHEIFIRMKAARGTDRESDELRIFADRMVYLYENQCDESAFTSDTEDLIRLASIGEAAEDAARTESLEEVNAL